MTAARLITVGAAAIAAGDRAGQQIARALLAEGMPVASREVVDEDESAVEVSLGAAVAQPALVVVLEAPGGSAGELVRRVLARLADTRLVLSDKLLGMIEDDFSRRGQAMPRRLDRLALLPSGAELWPAPAGAPGWTLSVRDALVVVLPVDSAHLRVLVDDRLRPIARERTAGAVTLLRTLLTSGLAPADAEERLGPWLGKEGPVAVSTVLVHGDDVWVRLLARGVSRGLAERELSPVETAIREALGDDCYGQDDDTLELVVGNLLLARGLTVSVAESCTGGLLAERLTAVPGASRYFERGVVVYSNRAKQELLGVPEPLLRAHGAVSAPVAEAMAGGVCRVARSPCGLAITGFSGPGGGTEDKPVGTVFVACATPGQDGERRIEVRRLRFAGGRDAVRWQSAQAALDMLRRALPRDRQPPG